MLNCQQKKSFNFNEILNFWKWINNKLMVPILLQVDRIFRKYDLNQDGVITLEEFLEACLKDSVIIDAIQMFDKDC